MSSKLALWLLMLTLCLVCLPSPGRGGCTPTGDLYTSTIIQCASAYNDLACCDFTTYLCDAYPSNIIITCPSSIRVPACCN